MKTGLLAVAAVVAMYLADSHWNAGRYVAAARAVGRQIALSFGWG